MKTTDLLVIGGGPAGYSAAVRAARKGLNVLLVEDRDLGGTCLNRGCIPTKALYKAQEVVHLVRRAADFGVKGRFEGIDWTRVQNRKNKIVKQLTGGVSLLLKKAPVETVFGHASFLDARTVRVNQASGEQEEVRAERIYLASGSKSAPLSVPGADLPGVVDSEEALEFSEVPRKLVVIGGGYIGIEMACIYQAFGSDVTVIEMLPGILPTADEETSALLASLLQKQGMQIRTGARVKEIRKNGGLQVVFEHEGETRYAEGDYVLVATGRIPSTEGLDLEAAGVLVNGKAVKTDAAMRTSVPHIYAGGDVNGKHLLAHVAYRESEVAVSTMTGNEKRIDYRAVPAVIFSVPEIASVGLTEAQARLAGYEISVGRFPFRLNGKALIEGETEGFVKIIANAPTGEILGTHIVGPRASDLIAEFVLAMNLEGTTEEVAGSIHAHPTLSEVNMEAAEAVFGASVHVP
ncbi:MAG TPA: dihydrolipoyl dehydrogenase [Atribacteraceae bacterium]|nr:dihydrolipoyl dehydrogenase [Atribacteraceae bacterium]